MGCLFSVNEFMLATRRGRAYARQIPTGQLLLETDLPAEPGHPLAVSPAEHARRLRASYYFVGTLLACFGKAEVSYPGGCTIGTSAR